MATEETILTLGDLVIPAGAGRNISQTLQFIDNGDVRRTINGTLTDLTRVVNRKFESQISTIDQATPAITELFKGQAILVECISKLRQNVFPASTTETLIRDPVVSSVLGRDSSGAPINPTIVGGTGNRDITFAVNIVLIEFRPILNMMVLANSINTDEYGASEGWTLDLEEV